MRAKWSLIATILSLLAASLSCNLPSAPKPVGSTNPGTSPQTSPSQKPQSSQKPGKITPSSTASAWDFQGGISARQGYKMALEKAQEWNPNAVLWNISLPYESPSANPEGKSSGWIFMFTDDTLQSPEDRSLGYYVTAGEKGVIDAKPASVNISENFIQADPADWAIDSGQAVDLCEQSGGTDYRNTHPGIVIQPELAMQGYQDPNGLASPTPKNVSWYVSYRDRQTGIGLDCRIDGTNGKVFAISNPLDATDDTFQPVTARQGYDLALARAQEWDKGAALIEVRVEFPQGDKTWPLGGLARFWHYSFIALPQPEKGDFQPDFEVTTSSKGILAFRPGVDTNGYRAVADSTDWLTDSDAAFRAAEEKGGKAFRDEHPDAIFGMMLYLTPKVIEEENGTKNIRWEVGYSVENTDTDITYYVDGATGEVVATYP